MATVNEKMTAIADAIRNYKGGSTLLSLDDIAKDIDLIWEMGVTYGFHEGEAIGSQAYHDKFWDVFQDCGNRTNYTYAFYMWTGALFRPVYDIMPINTCTSLFRDFKGVQSLPDRLKECGVILDLSKVTTFSYSFCNSGVQETGELDLSAATDISHCFYNSKVKIINKLKLRDMGTAYTNAFNKCSDLETLNIEGVICKNGFNVSWSPKLTHESLLSIINCLKDYSTSGTTYTVTLGATNLAKLTDSEKAIATQKGWTLA